MSALARKCLRLTCAASLLSLLCSALVGCGNTQAEDESWTPRESRVQPHLYMSEADIIMYPDQADTDAIAAALEAFGTRCMTERGFGGVASAGRDVAAVQRVHEEAAIRDVYGYVPPEDAPKQGVTARGWYESMTRNDDAAPSPAYKEALHGQTVNGHPTPDSCQGQAIARFLPHYDRFLQINSEIEKLNLQVENDSAYKKVEADATQRWAACMAQAGYSQFKTVESLSSPTGDENSNVGWPAPNPGPEEVAVARASSTCMIDTRYLEDVSRANAQAVHRLIAKKPGLITEWQKLRRAQVDAVAGQ